MSDPSSGAAIQRGVSQSQTLSAKPREAGASARSRDRAARGRRVLIIVENLPLPFDRRVWQEARALTAAGYTVSIICPKAPAFEKSFERIDGIDIHRHSLPQEADGLLGYAVEYSCALFMEFVLSAGGQKIWAYRHGTPGGPERYTLRRLPILPALYAPELARYRADPDENPYAEGALFQYHEAWTGPLFGAIAFVVRAMCVDTEPELAEAYGALADAGFPPRATAAFDDLSLVDYRAVSGSIRAALKARDPLQEAAWSRRLVHHFRDLYRNVTALARAGQ